MSHGLGRRLAPDPRDTAFPMAAVLPQRSVRPYRYWWTGGAWLDQGAYSTCVGHAWAHWTEDGPVTHPGTIDPVAIYREATQLDPWPENDGGDLDFGTSVRAGAQALQARGRISEYRWAWSVDDVVTAVLEVGPVVVGTWWTEAMFTPDREGIVRYEGSHVGGHAYVINGMDMYRGLARAKNSWGRSFGRNGFFSLPLEDLDQLIRADGEACLALEVPS
jgi:hypothetical protein